MNGFQRQSSKPKVPPTSARRGRCIREGITQAALTLPSQGQWHEVNATLPSWRM
jgi:hypothetical protein